MNREIIAYKCNTSIVLYIHRKKIDIRLSSGVWKLEGVSSFNNSDSLVIVGYLLEFTSSYTDGSCLTRLLLPCTNTNYSAQYVFTWIFFSELASNFLSTSDPYALGFTIS